MKNPGSTAAVGWFFFLHTSNLFLWRRFMLQIRRKEYQRIHIDWLSFASALRPVHIYCDNDCDCGCLKDRFHWFPWFLKWNCVHWNYIEQESIPVGCNRPVASAVPVTSIAARCQLLGWCPQVNRFEQGGHNLPYPGTQGVCPVRSDLSWVMITWEPPSPLVDRQTRLKTLPSCNFNGERQ